MNPVNKDDILVWYECDISGGPDWSLIDLVNNWPDKKKKFIVYVNANHEGLKLLKSKSNERFIIRSVSKYFFISYWKKKFKKIFNNFISNFFLIPIFAITSFFLFFYGFILFLRSNKEYIVFSNGGYPGGFSNYPIMLLAKFLCFKKKIMIIRSHVNDIKFRFIFDILTNLCLNKLIVISKVIKSEIINRNIFSEKKVEIIYPGIDSNRIKFNEKQIFVKEDFVIGIVGHLSSRKGHVILFDAINEIYKKFENLKIHIIGSDVTEKNNKKSQKKFLMQIAKKNGFEEIIYWTNYSNNVLFHIRRMDILVLPSIKDESFGRVIVEAMSQKTSVIGSNTGGIPEIIKDGYNGLLFKEGSSNELCDKINYLMQNKNEKEKFIINGLNTFKEYFDVKKYSENYLNSLNK